MWHLPLQHNEVADEIPITHLGAQGSGIMKSPGSKAHLFFPADYSYEVSTDVYSHVIAWLHCFGMPVCM